MLDQLKTRAHALKREVVAVYLAAKDPRTPWYAKGLVFLIVAYALSPIDLIPDFVPVLGYLDDLIIIPGGIWVAMRLVPPEVLREGREAAATDRVERRVGGAGIVIVILLWIFLLLAALYLVLRFTKRI